MEVLARAETEYAQLLEGCMTFRDWLLMQGFSLKESEVLNLIADGHIKSEIEQILKLSRHEVNLLVRSVCNKSGMDPKKRAELVARYGHIKLRLFKHEREKVIANVVNSNELPKGRSA
jgi:DNA-binding CsgD family transcriptional regulator